MGRLPLVLASASPRRARLLRDLGLDPTILRTDADERPLSGETAAAHAIRLSAVKASRALEALRTERTAGLVMTADTVVVLDGEILGKPIDADDAVKTLLRLAGRAHEVVTAVRLVRTTDESVSSAFEVSRVRFRAFGEPIARWYVSTGEPADKAGSYGIQGIGALLSEGIDGSWSNVVGLPIESLPSLFDGLGEDLWQRISDDGRAP